VTKFCVGTAAWGETSPDHGVSVPEEQAIEAALATFNSPLNYLDTSNNYGGGESEHRIGKAIARNGGLPQGFVLQTKLDRDPITGSFDAARPRTSLEESLTRLGLDRVPVLFLHDPEIIGFEAAMEPGGPVDTTVALHDEGYCDVIAVGGAPVSMMRQFVATDIFDVILTHNRYTLLDRSADILIGEATARGQGVINGAVFADAGIALIDAAIQFSLQDERIDSTVCGLESAQQLDRPIESATAQIPPALWDELDSLCPRASIG
jgi:D-threo-aldose 1-dehydrogenase